MKDGHGSYQDKLRAGRLTDLFYPPAPKAATKSPSPHLASFEEKSRQIRQTEGQAKLLPSAWRGMARLA
jgi:hypothetical protein